MSARQPFGLDTGATPDFVARATQLRKLYELIERKAGVKYESEAAEVTAEAVAFASAAAMATSNAEAKLIGYVEEIEPGRGASELAAAKVTL